jgi:OmpA-OmpF porin, OOP family
MYKQRLRLATLVASVGVFCAGNALADGFYFGLSGGVTSVDLSKSDIDTANATQFGQSFPAPYAQTLTSKLDDSGKGWGFQVGYRWGSYVAAEVGYVDLGRALYTGQLQYIDSRTPPLLAARTVDAQTRFQSSGPTASLLGMFPVGERFDVYARAGLYFGDTRIRTRSSIQQIPDSASSREAKPSSTDLLFGLGATWNINDSYSVRLEYQRFADVGDAGDGGEANVDLISVGFLFR